MLDVHPPHSPTHTWKDFFVHIATIVVGLLIAVGLEQSAEYVHHRHQLAETREALRLEREKNHDHFAREVSFWRLGLAALENNLFVLEYLQKHPGTPASKLPGVLYWGHNHATFITVAWDSAQLSGIVSSLPPRESATDQALYHEFARYAAYEENTWQSVIHASQFQVSDPDPTSLTPVQLQEVVDRTQAAINNQYLEGNELSNLAWIFPDFNPKISGEELAHINHLAMDIRQLANGSNPPADLTLQRLKAAGFPTSLSPAPTEPAANQAK